MNDEIKNIISFNFELFNQFSFCKFIELNIVKSSAELANKSTFLIQIFKTYSKIKKVLLNLLLNSLESYINLFNNKLNMEYYFEVLYSLLSNNEDIKLFEIKLTKILLQLGENIKNNYNYKYYKTIFKFTNKLVLENQIFDYSTSNKSEIKKEELVANLKSSINSFNKEKLKLIDDIN